MSQEKGRYIYCIIGDGEEKKFTFPAIGSGKDGGACPVRNIPQAGRIAKLLMGSTASPIRILQQ